MHGIPFLKLGDASGYIYHPLSEKEVVLLSNWRVKYGLTRKLEATYSFCPRGAFILYILPVFHPKEVSKHASNIDCWVILDDLVFNVSNFLTKHPGKLQLYLFKYCRRFSSTFGFRWKRHFGSLQQHSSFIKSNSIFEIGNCWENKQSTVLHDSSFARKTSPLKKREATQSKMMKVYE